MRLPLPDAVRNPVSLAGIATATAMAAVFIVLLLLDAFGLLTNPYIGLLEFITIPALFLVGLALIPVGVWWSARRRRHHPGVEEWPVIDLRVPRHRRVLAAVLVLTLVNVVLVSVAAYGGVHYMDSPAFCGQVCHTTMEPQYVAHQQFPHARVSCTSCHVGPGPGAFLEAKLAGTRRLFAVMTGNVPKPVPPPEHLIRPARDTCEGCHWPEQFHGDTVRIIREYADDERNSEPTTRLTLHVGGGSAARGIGTGIHWHMNLNNRIEYVVGGEDGQAVPYVRLEDSQGRVREYFAEGAAPEHVAGRPRRRMDCMDCHNRPAHTFHVTPQRAIDTAIAQGRIPRELPFVRRESVAAVRQTYPDRRSALEAIARRLRDFYASRGGADARLVAQAIAGAQDVWSQNVFPAMNVTWGTYPNNIGHIDAPGCFRCHDDSHKAADGTVIRQDCELCHTLE